MKFDFFLEIVTSCAKMHTKGLPFKWVKCTATVQVSKY